MKLLFLSLSLAAAAHAQTPHDLDLFLLIGQSNMAGRGVVEDVDKQPLPRIFSFDKEMKWVPAVDPLHFDKPTMVGVGLGRSFAKTLSAARPQASIGLIPAAFGGSALSEWEPGTEHYRNAIARAKEAMKSGRLRGILWHQGESESGKQELASTYRERFAKFIASLRHDLDAADVPVIVGQLGEFHKAAFNNLVNEQLALIPLAVPHAAFVSSAGLEHKGDSVHFNAASQREFGRRYALAFLALDAKWASEPEPDKAAAAHDTPSDVEAYRTASRIPDGEQRIAALEKFKRDFPTSSMKDSVDEDIFIALVKKLPGQQARIRKAAKSLYDQAEPAQKARTANNIATELVDAGILLKDAEDWAQKGLKPLSLTAYLAEQKASFERRKQPLPPEAELTKRFNTLRAGRQATLGRVLVKRGQLEKGRKLLEEVYALNPAQIGVAGALGEMAAKRGDNEKALEYLSVARLGGRTTPTEMATFENIWRVTHGGSSEGIDTALDEEYRKRFPNPVKVEPYLATAKRSDRVVLAELYTGSGCPPCTAADLAFDAALERYARNDLVVLVDHLHIPRPDPMTTPDTVARAKAKAVNSTPTFIVDGKKYGGGGPRDLAPEVYEKIRDSIEKDLEKAAGARITLRGAASGATVNVHAAVDQLDAAAKRPQLRLALVEKELRYSGENGIRFHSMVVRSLASFPLAAASNHVEHAFDLEKLAAAHKQYLDEYEASGHRGDSFKFREKKNTINLKHLALAAFVEDEGGNVLQAAWFDLTPQP